MKRYTVLVPVAGCIYVEVEAEDEDDAIDKAMEAEWTMNDVVELESYRRLAEGNVMHATYDEAEVVDEEEI